MKSRLIGVLALGALLLTWLPFVPPSPVQAQGEVWELVETIISPAGGSAEKVIGTPLAGEERRTLENMQGYHKYTTTVNAEKIVIIQNSEDWNTNADPDVKVNFTITTTLTFDAPEVLTPGQVATFKFTGSVKSEGELAGTGYTHLATAIRYGGLFMGMESFQYVTSGEERISLRGVPPGPITKSGSVSYKIPDVSPGEQIEIYVGGGLSGTSGGIRWIYRTAEDKLAVKHFPPFEHFKAGTGTDIKPAGDIVATLKDEKGKGIKGELVVFYVDPETPARDEPGKNLWEALETIPQTENKPPVRIKNETPVRKYLGGIQTDASGEARINYLTEIGPKLFSGELITQKTTFEERGNISGTVWAGVWNQKTESLERLTPIPIEITAMAKILKISGKGSSDEFKRAFLKEHPEAWAWGPGRVRVKRILGLPKFDYQPVDEGFLLMPGDIVDIDGGVAVEIAWVTGDKATARVPGMSEADTSQEYHEHARLIMLSSAYDSKFRSTAGEVGAGIENFVFGFTVGKGVDFVVESLGVVGKAAKLGFDVYKEISAEMKDLDLSKIDIITRIRIRSKVIIDNTGEDLKVYNLEGSPDIQTAAGGEVALEEGKMVAVSDTGVLGKVETFNVKEVEKEFYEREPAISPSKPAGADSSTGKTGGGSSSGLIIGVIAVVVVALAFFVLRKRARKA